MMSKACSCIVVFGILVLVTDTAVAQDCARSDELTYNPQVEEALVKWEASRKIAVVETAKGKVLKDYCAAAKRLVTERNISADSVGAVSDRIVFGYLDRAADPNKAGQSMSAVMRVEFGAAGLSPPEVKRFGKLLITYTLDVDAIRVRDKSYGRLAGLLLELGPARIEGMKSQKRMCAGDVQIDASVVANFRC
jgi:hypothetical protein